MSITLQVKGNGPYEVIESAEPIDGYTSMSLEEYNALSATYVPPSPVADIIKLDADLVLSRLTTAEQEALFTARRTVWQVDYFLTRAATTGIISTNDADLPAAQEMFAQLGIIAADRWTDLLAL